MDHLITTSTKISPNACKSNYANDTPVRNEHYADYIACQSDLKVMYGYWCRPGFKSGHQLFYLPLFRIGWENYLQKMWNNELYASSNIEWKLVKETFPELFVLTYTKSMNWLILSERSDNYLLHAYQKCLSSGIQTLLKETKYDPGNLMHIA